jgi:hypothetical protein
MEIECRKEKMYMRSKRRFYISLRCIFVMRNNFTKYYAVCGARGSVVG